MIVFSLVVLMLIEFTHVDLQAANSNQRTVDLLSTQTVANSTATMSQKMKVANFWGNVSSSSKYNVTAVATYLKGNKWVKDTATAQRAISPGYGFAARTTMGYNSYRLRLVPGNDTTSDIKKKCIATGYILGDY